MAFPATSLSLWATRLHPPMVQVTSFRSQPPPGAYSVRVVSCSGDVGLYQNPRFHPLPPALRTYRIRNDILLLGFIRDAEKSGSLEGWLFSEEHIKQSRQLSLLLCVTGVAGSVVGELCEIMCQDALGFLPRKIYRVSQRD